MWVLGDDKHPKSVSAVDGTFVREPTAENAPPNTAIPEYHQAMERLDGGKLRKTFCVRRVMMWVRPCNMQLRATIQRDRRYLRVA